LKADTIDEAIYGSSIDEDATADCTTKAPVSVLSPQEGELSLQETESSKTLPPITADGEPIPLPYASSPVYECTPNAKQDEEPTIDMSQSQLCQLKTNLERRILELYQSHQLAQSRLDRVNQLIADRHTKFSSESQRNLDKVTAEVDRELEPHDLPSTFDAASTSVRVSLEQYCSLTIQGRINPMDTCTNTALESNGIHEHIAVRAPTPMTLKQWDEVADDPDSDDATIQSTQTVDPSNNASFAVQESAYTPLAGDETVISTTRLPVHDTNGNANTRPQRSRTSHANTSLKRKPFQITSADHDNRKKNRPTCHLGTDPGKDKRLPTGWVTNRSARVFLRQLEQQPPQPIDAIRSTSKPVNPKSDKAPTKWTSKSSDDGLEEGPSYAYKEVVRKQCERKTLNCYDCPNCQKFYAALRKTGHVDDIAILSRGGKRTHQTIAGESSAEDDIQVGNVSFGRHRARFAQSETPVDFWELDFIDERDAAATPSNR
jgi:DNA repair protein endonuclease SAE2/CtIP C-terminus